MPRCGRPDFKTSPARWALISIRASSGNSATPREPSILPSTNAPNSSGQQAAQSLADRLREQGVNARRVSLPEGHDPNSFFVQGGDGRQFQLLLEAAQ